MKVNLLQGRFQPFTLGHMKCVEAAAAKGLPTVIAQIETKSADKKHPFTDDMLEKPMKDLVKDTKDIIDIIKVKNANIVAIGEEFAKHGYEITSWTCGTDRIDSYSKMSTKYHDDAKLTDDFQMIEIKRGDEDISATKVRNSCMGGDEATFKKLTPKCMHKYYKMFQDQLKKVNEHKMKTLSEYISESLLNESSNYRTAKEWIKKYEKISDTMSDSEANDLGEIAYELFGDIQGNDYSEWFNEFANDWYAMDIESRNEFLEDAYKLMKKIK